MGQKHNLPKTETELNRLLDSFYAKAKKQYESGKTIKFKGLLEIISCEVNIITAIHTIKSNGGAKTGGSDGIIINDILYKNYDEIIDGVKENFKNYRPLPVRRVWIDKEGKTEKRPLGIPTIIDRITQECVRKVLEPILEAQFFRHSYGFRTMRDAHMAVKRITTVIHRTGQQWVVEGDISKFFDNVNHRIMIKKLYNMGIKDRRVLMLIQAMLKAGIMDEKAVNDIGTPQGGIISPLLANVYLDSLDKWIAREWEEKVTKTNYADHKGKLKALHKTNLKPTYFVRYADDWVLITDSKKNAEKWKFKISKYLESNLKLKLSEEKTLITDCSKKAIKFLGFEIKANIVFKAPRGMKKIKNIPKSRKVYLTQVSPDGEKFSKKVTQIRKEIKKLKHIPDRDKMIHQVNIINSMIRGVVNYFTIATDIGVTTKKYSSSLQIYSYICLKRHGVELVETSKLSNLLEVHKDYNQTVPAINVGEGNQKVYVGLTNLSFTKWKEPQSKNQEETPFTPEGRELYNKRMKKKSKLARADEYFNLDVSYIIAEGLKGKKYNFEYYMNRGYVINRDKFKCRVCKGNLEMGNTHIHHTKPYLDINKINKVSHLASVCSLCHCKIHDSSDISGDKDKKKLMYFRNMLINNSDSKLEVK